MGSASTMSAFDPDRDASSPHAIPGPEQIVHALRQSGLITGSEDVRLDPEAKNPSRSDSHRKHAFRVTRDGSPWCFLTIGSGVRDLWQRTSAFAEACPDISCQPLFFASVGRYEMMGVSLFEGADVEKLLESGKLSTDGLRATLARIQQALASTRRASDVSSAAVELDDFSSQVLQAPVFNEVDRQLLRDVILPFVREHALRGVMETRFTNGDFVARNILQADDGTCRLIDHEFAGRTHFSAADLWRWRSFSKLPGDLLDLAATPESTPPPAWIEVYSILQHLVLVEGSQGTAVALAEARIRLPQLLATLFAAAPGVRSSLIWSALTPAMPVHPAAPAGGLVSAQLFWSRTGAFNENESRRISYACNTDAHITFLIPSVSDDVQLRLDPVEAPGLVRISSLHIHRASDGMTSPVLTLRDGWDRVHVLAGLLRLSPASTMTLLSLNIDPSLRLPTLSLGGKPCDILVEVHLRYEPTLDALPSLLAR